MSSLPGLTLESFVMWNHDLIVEEDSSANPSLQIAEALGFNTCRTKLSRKSFAKIVAVYEPYRETIEYRMGNFDEDTQSWRDYAGTCFNDITDSIGNDISKALEALTNN